MKNKVKTVGIIVGVAVFWIGIWQILSMTISSELLLPSPVKVLSVWWNLIQTSDFWVATGFTLLRIALGFLTAVVAGVLLAVATAHSRVIYSLISPILKIVRAAPVASFIIFALVWIKTNFLPLWISFLMVLPIVWENVSEGINHIDPKLLEMAKVHRVSKKKIWTGIQLPSVLPYLLAAVKTGLGFAWKSGIAAEIICRPENSIGNFLQQAKVSLETPEVFAWTATVIVLSVVLEKALEFLTTRYQNHRKGEV